MEDYYQILQVIKKDNGEVAKATYPQRYATFDVALRIYSERVHDIGTVSTLVDGTVAMVNIVKVTTTVVTDIETVL